MVPLRYPMSVRWGGDDGLAIGSGDDAIDAARTAGKVAILDPRTEVLTGLHAGKVAITVTNESMRQYTDDGSLAPITVSKTVTVKPYTGPGPRGDVATPVFPDQIVGTISAAQKVVVRNTGDQPLHVGDVKIADADGESAGEFVIADDGCASVTVAAGASCTILVRFAPARESVSSHETLTIGDDSADRSHAIDLTGTSVPAPTAGEKGDPGRDAAITCKVKGNKNVVCTVVFVATKPSTRTTKTTAAKLQASSARLTRNGRIYAKGSVARLRTVRKVVTGGYSLRVGGGKSATVHRITIRWRRSGPAATQRPVASSCRASLLRGAGPAARPSCAMRTRHPASPERHTVPA